MRLVERFAISALLGVASITAVQAGGPNPNLKYFGYDWVDSGTDTADSSLAAINSTGPASTNLNVVHTLSELNSAACQNKKCALNFSAGYYQEFDICPNSSSYEQCVSPSKNPWAKIWELSNKIYLSNSKPAAIYFIDEPSIHPAFRNSSGGYVPWSYASFLCTLRDAMSAKGLEIPIYTILAMGELPANPDDPNYITKELRQQMPTNGCSSGRRSMPDWIGIDNYTWRHEAGVQNDSSVIHALYDKYFPNDLVKPKWVLVPPSHTVLYSPPITDQQFHDRIQVYWDLLSSYPTAPIVAIMAFRFDKDIMTVPPGVDPNNQSDPRNKYWRSRSLLKYIGNVAVN